jgi:hypothetical protein
MAVLGAHDRGDTQSGGLQMSGCVHGYGQSVGHGVRELVLAEASAAASGEQNGAQRCVCNHDVERL